MHFRCTTTLPSLPLGRPVRVVQKHAEDTTVRYTRMHGRMRILISGPAAVLCSSSCRLSPEPPLRGGAACRCPFAAACPATGRVVVAVRLVHSNMLAPTRRTSRACAGVDDHGVAGVHLLGADSGRRWPLSRALRPLWTRLRLVPTVYPLCAARSPQATTGGTVAAPRKLTRQVSCECWLNGWLYAYGCRTAMLRNWIWKLAETACGAGSPANWLHNWSSNPAASHTTWPPCGVLCAAQQHHQAPHVSGCDRPTCSAGLLCSERGGLRQPSMLYVGWSGRAERFEFFCPPHVGAGPSRNKGWEELRAPAAHGVLVGVGPWL